MSSVDVSEAGANVDLMSQSALRKKFPWLAVDDVELASYGQSSTRCGHCRKGNINKNCLYVTVLCTIIMVHKDTSSILLAGRLTVSGFDLAWFSSLSSKRLCVFGLNGTI